MTDIVSAPPFMPSKPQWDATLKLLERALEELAQAAASAVETARIVGAERDAARAEVARLTERANKLASALSLVVFAMPDAAVELAREAWGNTNTNNVNDALENAHNVLGTSDPEDAGDMAMPQGGALNGN